jgi:hypothetical protein
MHMRSFLKEYDTDMAIWQFKLEFAPTSTIRARTQGVLPAAISKDMADNPFWSDIQPPQELEKWIDAILPRASSWSEEMDMWGDQDGDFASVCYTNEKKDRVEEISFRVDVRNISGDFVKAICSLARACGCVLITARHQVLQPDESVLGEAIQVSIAKRYLEDPVAALQSLEPSETIDLPPKKNN